MRPVTIDADDLQVLMEYAAKDIPDGDTEHEVNKVLARCGYVLDCSEEEGTETAVRSFTGWAIVELMGHRKLGGHVTEQEIAGSAFLRLDVHGAEGPAVTTQFYSPGAVYCITPTTEDIARKVGERSRPQPVARFELEAPKPRPEVVHDGQCDDRWCGGECTSEPGPF